VTKNASFAALLALDIKNISSDSLNTAYLCFILDILVKVINNTLVNQQFQKSLSNSRKISLYNAINKEKLCFMYVDVIKLKNMKYSTKKSMQENIQELCKKRKIHMNCDH
jgi:hypothetical protein